MFDIVEVVRVNTPPSCSVMTCYKPVNYNHLQGEIGEKATTLITELVKDNRMIIDRIPREDIDKIIELVKEFKVRCA